MTQTKLTKFIDGHKQSHNLCLMGLRHLINIPLGVIGTFFHACCPSQVFDRSLSLPPDDFCTEVQSLTSPHAPSTHTTTQCRVDATTIQHRVDVENAMLPSTRSRKASARQREELEAAREEEEKGNLDLTGQTGPSGGLVSGPAAAAAAGSGEACDGGRKGDRGGARAGACGGASGGGEEAAASHNVIRQNITSYEEILPPPFAATPGHPAVALAPGAPGPGAAGDPSAPALTGSRGGGGGGRGGRAGRRGCLTGGVALAAIRAPPPAAEEDKYAAWEKRMLRETAAAERKNVIAAENIAAVPAEISNLEAEIRELKEMMQNLGKSGED